MLTNRPPQLGHGLLIDTEPSGLAILSQWASAIGLEPHAVASHEQALSSLIAGDQTDIVVMGAHSDIVNACRFLQLLHSPAFAPYSDIPIILLCSEAADVASTALSARARTKRAYVAPWDQTAFHSLVHDLMAGEASLSQPRLLLATQDPHDCAEPGADIALALSALGFTVDTRCSLQACREAISCTRYEMALIDERLPNDGAEGLLQACHQVQPGCTCLVMSQQEDPRRYLKWFSLGATDYVKLGCRTTKLVETCQQAHAHRVATDAVSELMRRASAHELGKNVMGQVLRHSHDIYYQQNVDSGGFEYINPVVESVLGWTPEEVLGMDQAGLLDQLHPDDLDKILSLPQGLAEAAERGDPCIDREVRIRAKDGAYRCMHGRFITTQDRWGKPKSIIGTLEDVTDYVRAEQELRASHRLLDRAQELSRTCAWEMDLETGESSVSRNWLRILGFDDADTGWVDYEAVIHPDDLPILTQAAADAIAGAAPYECEHRVVCADGAHLLIHCRGEVIRDDAGKPLRILGVSQDITEQRETEKALAESEARFREMVYAAPMAVLAIRDGQFAFVNPASAELLGFDTPCEMLGQDAFQAVAPDQREMARLRLAHAERGRENEATDLKLVRPDGTVVWTRSASVPVNLDGEPAALVVAQDISAAREAEQALRRSRENLHAMIDAIPDAAFLMTADGIALEANEAVAGLVAMDRRDFIGTDVYATIPPAVAQARRRHAAQVLASGEPGELVDECFGLTVRSRVFPVAGEDGDEPRVAIVSVDITDAIRREAELARRLSAIEASLDGIAIWDSEGTCIYCNHAHARHLGCDSPEACLGSNYLSLCAPSQREQFRNMVMPAILNRSSWRGEILGQKADGAQMEVELCLSCLDDGGVVSVARDISERKQAERDYQEAQARLVQAQKMESVGRLAGGVAHDFNNMLTVILGHTDFALEDLDPRSDLHQALVEIRQAGERSANLTKQLLAYARRQSIAPEVLDLNASVEEMLRMLRRLIGEDIGLDWQPGRELWPVRIDPSQVDQIMANLCVNARDAIGGIGEVTIETRNVTVTDEWDNPVPGDYVMLAVSDTGCGIDAETLDNLFEPFFTTKGVGEGTGLGLATVHGIVAQNGGAIRVSSELGQGAAFRIYLPRHDMEPVAETPTAAVQAKSGRGTILLVEDEPAILRMIQIGLERNGYTVLAMPTPGEAIHAARENRHDVDLLISDIVMPEMSGRDLARTVRDICPQAAVLFISGYTGHEPLAADDPIREARLVTKPFTMEHLHGQVRAALTERGAI